MTFDRNGIKVVAISYDSQEVLSDFAARHGITYPLLSDEGSSVIREFGILNPNIPHDHHWYGVPYPGLYMVGEDGLVFEKNFVAQHGRRESANDMLLEGFNAKDVDHSEAQEVATPHLSARAYFASPTIRPGQLMVLTVRISAAEGIHINGRPLPAGYTPVELTVEGNQGLVLERVDYPEPQTMVLEALNETLPVYTHQIELKGRCRSVTKGDEGPISVNVGLTYQACDDRACFLPETLSFTLPLLSLPHAR